MTKSDQMAVRTEHSQNQIKLPVIVLSRRQRYIVRFVRSNRDSNFHWSFYCLEVTSGMIGLVHTI